MFNALISACERAGDYEKAFEFFDMMRTESVSANGVYVYVCISCVRVCLHYMHVCKLLCGRSSSLT